MVCFLKDQEKSTFTQPPKWERGPTCVIVLPPTMRHFRKLFSSSSTPTNSPPRTPTPPITEYIKQGVATFYPRTKDKRALAASSSAIAISIASPPRDPTDVAPDKPGSSKNSAWKAAYGAARMAVEIAKDSSDMLPPLKAVMTALLVLFKNYDVNPPPSRPMDR